MFAIIGIVVVLGAVIGGFLMEKGHICLLYTSVAAAFWMACGAFTLPAKLAGVLAPIGRHRVGCGRHYLVPCAGLLCRSVPLRPAGVYGRACRRALAADHGCEGAGAGCGCVVFAIC